jgi:lipid-binding SYLF domain-containing protein
VHPTGGPARRLNYLNSKIREVFGIRHFGVVVPKRITPIRLLTCDNESGKAIMLRALLTILAVILPLFGTGCGGPPGQEQTLVDRSTLTVQDMMTQTLSDKPVQLLRKAKGVLICPSQFRAGFFIGGEGGNCVLLGRAGYGAWSYPAFYSVGAGSFGFQFGVQNEELFLLIRTEKGLNAVLDNQFSLGPKAGVTVAVYGVDAQAATTAALGADIVAFASSRGLFGGIATQLSLFSQQTGWNQSYYGQSFGGRQIVALMQGINPGADSLRQMLARYGAPGPSTNAQVQGIGPIPGPP